MCSFYRHFKISLEKPYVFDNVCFDFIECTLTAEHVDDLLSREELEDVLDVHKSGLKVAWPNSWDSSKAAAFCAVVNA